MNWLTLTRISTLTGFLTLCVQGAVLFGWDISSDQQAWITSAIVAAGAVIHTLLNPDIPIGKTGSP